MRNVLLLLVLSSMLVLAACNKERNARKNNVIPPTELTDIVSKRSVVRLWSQSFGEGEGRLGSRQGAAIADGLVFVSDREAGLRAINLQTGSTQWSDTSLLGISSTPGVGEGLLVVGTLDGTAVAYDAASGSTRWTAQLSAEILAAPQISRGIVVVRGIDNRVYGLNANSGERMWLYDRSSPALSLRGNSPVLVQDSMVFAGFDDGHVVALRLSDGGLVWDQIVGVSEGRTDLERMVDIDGSMVSSGAELYAASYQGQISALAVESGRPLWGRPQSSYAGLVLVGDLIVTVDADGNVWALDRQGGSSMWKQDKLAHRWLSSPALQGNTIVVADLEGYIHWIDVDSGELVARQQLDDEPIRAAPMVSGDVVVVQTTDGKLAAYRMTTP